MFRFVNRFWRCDRMRFVVIYDMRARQIEKKIAQSLFKSTGSGHGKNGYR